METAAAAASSLLSVLPCSHKVDGAMGVPGVTSALRHVAAVEHMLTHWGTQVRWQGLVCCVVGASAWLQAR
jgi:hypothetical protein